MQGSINPGQGAINFSLCAKRVAYPSTANIPVLNEPLQPDWIPAPNFADPNAVSYGVFKGLLPNGLPFSYKLPGARLDIFRREGKILFRWHFSTNVFRYRREGASEAENAAMTYDVMLGPACPSPQVAYRVFPVANPAESLSSSGWIPFRGRLAMKGSSGGGN